MLARDARASGENEAFGYAPTVRRTRLELAAKKAAATLPGVQLLLDSGPLQALRMRLIRYPESRYTTPRGECQHPEWWTATDWDSTELEVIDLLAGFVRGLQPEYVVETGTALAQGSVAIGRALRRNGHGRLVTLEVDHGRVERARWRCRRLPVDVVEQSSLDFEPQQLIDLAWFDSLTDLRALEFRKYWPHMHSGTIVGFHDTGPAHPTKQFIDELESEGLLRPIHLATPRGVTFAQVLGRPVRPALTSDHQADDRAPVTASSKRGEAASGA